MTNIKALEIIKAGLFSTITFFVSTILLIALSDYIIEVIFNIDHLLFWVSIIIVITNIYVHIKLFKFDFNTDVLTETEFKNISKNKSQYYKGTVSFKSLSLFILFSVVFGVLYLGDIIFLIKRFIEIMKEKQKIKKTGDKYDFVWRKVKDTKNKDYTYYLYLENKPSLS